MFERARFTRYALRFERAYTSDRWDDVKACFHPDAHYIVIGTGTEYDQDVRGPDAIVTFFKRMLDACDRKFDTRRPRLASWPRVVDGALRLKWKARYTLGAESAVLTGAMSCRFEGGLIIELSDTMVASEVAAWIELSKKRAA
jgi:hypothetical protein